MTETIKSPCIRNCCLDESDICLGCCRSLDEIKKWQASSDVEKKAILKRAKQRMKQTKMTNNFKL